ncbi:hypothetical protein [Croceicoccus sp. YJ47]|uniref:hypothetical protein n=1 Tax=Croceicoccus sp. YJ47 TaxID=2798724 RepID=UPI00192228C6|nr:hypothetical protein [Croceicoccus sp. YJ47]QQN74628.1 hypothetical protein JD971_02370 [Croceicoccus sp. YJ47]
MKRAGAALVLTLWQGGAGAAFAQNAPADIDAMLARQKVMALPPAPTPCRPSSGDEIVVCAPVVRDERVASYTTRNPTSPEARNLGVPDVVDVDGMPPCLAFCVTSKFGYAPPPVYIVDFGALPDAPPGSDADRIARGEMRAD